MNIKKYLATTGLAVVIMLSSVIPAFAGSTQTTSNGVATAPVLNERVVKILEQNNIDFKSQDGKLKLVDRSPNSIAAANKLIASEFNTVNPNARAAVTAYPTPYTHMKHYDIFRSKKFEGASKTAFGAAVVEWAKGGLLPNPYKIGVAAVGGFAIYYFINTDKEDLYFAIKYYYREFGPGKFDHNGNFAGDYDVKKEIRVTKNSDYTGGNIETEVQQGTIIEPWF